MSGIRDDALDTDGALTEALAGWRTRERLSTDALRALKPRRRRGAAMAAGSVAAMLLAVGLVRYHAPAVPDRIAHLHTGRGEVRAVRLPDGSTIRLAGATRLSVRYTVDERSVALADGAAFFDVAHDADRPFTVRAGDGNVRVLGTAFDVDRTAGRMAVAVYRGAVRLAGSADTRGRWVPAGWRGRVVRGHAGSASRFDMASMGRQDDWLDVDDLRLADLVSILNRRSGRAILPPPASLADMPVSGRFRTDDAKSLLASLGTAYDFIVVDREDGLYLSRK